MSHRKHSSELSWSFVIFPLYRFAEKKYEYEYLHQFKFNFKLSFPLKTYKSIII